jgi:hypothetical protein
MHAAALAGRHAVLPSRAAGVRRQALSASCDHTTVLHCAACSPSSLVARARLESQGVAQDLRQPTVGKIEGKNRGRLEAGSQRCSGFCIVVHTRKGAWQNMVAVAANLGQEPSREYNSIEGSMTDIRRICCLCTQGKGPSP